MSATTKFYGWANDDLLPSEKNAVKARAERTVGHLTVHATGPRGPFWARVTSPAGFSVKLPSYSSAYHAAAAGLALLEDGEAMYQRGQAS